MKNNAKGKKGKIGKMWAAVLAFMLLCGCGKKLEVAEEVKLEEYRSPDGTYSIEADAGYEKIDMGMESWLGLEPEDGMDSVAVMQFPKKGSFMGGWANLGEAIAFMEESNGFTDKKEMETPQCPNLQNMEAYTYKMTQDDFTTKLYVVYGETDYAHYFLAYYEGMVKMRRDNYFADICASFREYEEAIGEKSVPAMEVTDTVRWFNASNSVLIDANQWDYRVYGGLEADEASMEVARQVLDNSWGVTDKETADETLLWLMEEGHRTEFTEEMELLESEGLGEVDEQARVSFLMENFELDEEWAQNYARWYGRYEENPEDAVSGWDYNRALSQLANFYLAGYYTLEEALDASLEVAKAIQGSFASWDDYMESYFTGYEYWAEEESTQRRGIYKGLQEAADNPFAVDFKTELEKSW